MIPDATVTVLLTVVVISAMLLGGSIVMFAHRAASRVGSKPLAMFSYGFGVVTLGFAVAGALSILFALPAREVVLVQGVFVLGGLGLLMRSLYVDLSAATGFE